ncbi:hypothetical protein [Pseudoduganella buxea]|uniref:Uncharacterized protein n=1 Tax=Pseudoduganella buxea TaxID=1949069 RepID=A0A6I3T9L5_9BURK|nr:hypothetical protein [Pseudoduganella buxea]MTV56367.1 hypothetical protein [Pseudoduganella buxea]GGC25466.1 hypothetical protein GCM10011572_53590 [Pseudoduganella buxea]
MGLSVVRVTFSDGARMYSSYCTIAEMMNPIIVSIPPELEQLMEEDANVSGEDPATTLYRIIIGGGAWPERLPDDVPFERVTCTLLFNGGIDHSWESQAQRHRMSGVISGSLGCANLALVPDPIEATYLSLNT